MNSFFENYLAPFPLLAVFSYINLRYTAYDCIVVADLFKSFVNCVI